MITREEAEKLESHLTGVADALERTFRFVAGFGREDRIRFSGLINDLADALHGNILSALYAQHPEMRPPTVEESEPEINSELRWDQVRLPSSISETEIDAVIFAVLKPQWRKVAAFVTEASDRYEALGQSIDLDIIVARLIALSEADRIEGIGDLRLWRHSEVRLKD